MAEKVFLNNKLVDINKAHISVADSGFLYGAGLFETMRACNGVVFALKDHLDRLFFSAAALSIENTYTRQQIADGVHKVLQTNELSDARLRLTLTGGPMSGSGEDRRSTLLITATKLTPYPEQYYRKGILVVLSPFRQNPADPVSGHKTTSYFSRMTALRLAHRNRAAEALWFTVDGRLAEGCISNVFLVRDSTLCTPPIETPVLAGVARKTVCEIAINKSIRLVEKPLSIDDVLAADEMFLTNVIMQVMPINSVEKHILGDGRVGPVTRQLQTEFDETVKRQCEKKQ